MRTHAIAIGTVLGSIAVSVGSGCRQSSPGSHERTPLSAASAAESAPSPSTPPPASTASPGALHRSRVFVERLPVPGDQEAFALRGSAPDAEMAGVFLHGWCGHGLGYLQAFQFAAAETGRYLALQGDRHCGATTKRAWSMDPDATDRRIRAALIAYLGEDVPGELLLGGSSQGVEVAVALARRFPERYRWLVLLSPSRPLPAHGLKRLRGVYFLVGEHENQWPARGMQHTWRHQGIPTRLEVIADAGHADFHGRGDDLMRAAFRNLGLAPRGARRPR